MQNNYSERSDIRNTKAVFSKQFWQGISGRFVGLMLLIGFVLMFLVAQALLQNQQIEQIITAEQAAKNTSHLVDSLRHISRVLGFLLLLSLVLLSFLGFIFLRYVQQAIGKPAAALEKLARGAAIPPLALQGNELDSLTQAINQLNEGVQRAGDFALQIGAGNFEADYQPTSQEDRLGNLLLEMRQQLHTAAREATQRTWATEGYAKMSDVIQANTHEEKILLERFLQQIIQYMGIEQGAIFLWEQDESEEWLELKTCYAYDRKKYTQKRIALNRQYPESLLEQVFVSHHHLLIDDLPPDYLRLVSGLGDTSPKHLLIMPLRANEQTQGVIELASLYPIEQYKIEFVARVSESLAGVLQYIKINQHTATLLKEAQLQREALRTQEEEMRQNLEELQSTQENMRLAQAELASKEQKLSALINNTMDSIICIDRQYRVMVINKVLLNRYKGTNYEGIDVGSNILDYLGGVRDEWKAHYDRALAGESFDFIIKSTVNTEDSYRHYYLNPIVENDQEIIGASVFSRDITKQKLQEINNEATIAELRRRLAQAEQALAQYLPYSSS